MLEYKYKETKKIRKLLNEIEALRIAFDTIEPLPHIEENIRRESILKSAVYSARIEGNPLRIEEVKKGSLSGSSKNISKLEIFNLQRANNFIYGKNAPKKVSPKLIKKFHRVVMKNISGSAGQFRNEPWGIFNSAGVAVYLAPAHFKIPKLIDQYVELLKNIKIEIPVRAAVAQFLFEKIHPFADGNGRVGRLISLHIMNTGGYGFRGLVSVEEIIDKNRDVYYTALEPGKNVNPFVSFFIESFISQAKAVFGMLGNIRKELPEDKLFPRRRELLEIIRDHPYCSFNFLLRRFQAINPKTLHYDIKKLQEDGFIIKIGKTRGVTYKAA
jgi:Fic family protein